MTFTTDIKVTLPVENEGDNPESEIKVEVEYRTYGKHIPAIWNVSPEEFPEVELESAVDESGKDWLPILDKRQVENLEEKAYQAAENYDPY